MASPTNISWKRRTAKKAAQGRKRKAYLRNHGSTAADLPLNMPNAQEKAQQAARAKA